MRTETIRYENVAVSTRVRLARNFADYPFPNKLSDRESAREIIKLVSTALNAVDDFELYYMDNISDERAAFLEECYFISRDLVRHRPISAVLVSRRKPAAEKLIAMLDESISVMINEEDHVRAQYFMRGYDLRKVYERISGIDDIISETLPFAFDEELGYLTACPTNLGTGLRASVMLFLPALTRRNRMRAVVPELKRLGLTVRGAFGEGSGSDGELYQISNEVTLGVSEAEILSVVEQAVDAVVEAEMKERGELLADPALPDALLRSLGILTNCLKMDEHEFISRMTDVKLGVALGLFDGSMEELDNLVAAMRPANINRLNGVPLRGDEYDFYRADYAGKRLREMKLLTETKRHDLSHRG